MYTHTHKHIDSLIHSTLLVVCNEPLQRGARRLRSNARPRGDAEPAPERDGRVRGERRDRGDGFHQPQGAKEAEENPTSTSRAIHSVYYHTTVRCGLFLYFCFYFCISFSILHVVGTGKRKKRVLLISYHQMVDAFFFPVHLTRQLGRAERLRALYVCSGGGLSVIFDSSAWFRRLYHVGVRLPV